MKLPPNPFKRALKEGGKQVGLWVSLGSNFAADVVAHAGFDWVLVDMEHSPNTLDTVLAQLQVFSASRSLAIVRPDWNDPVKVKRLLDIGARGLLFPMVETVEQAKAAVAATRYPPHGIRGVSGMTRANAFGRTKDYFEAVERETAVLIQLETVQAVENAAAFADVDGIDGIFFGPADIGADMGHLGQPMHPDVWDLIRPAARVLMEKGMPVGTLVMDAAFAAELLNDGFSFVACGTDASLLSRASDRLLKEVRENSGMEESL